MAILLLEASPRPDAGKGFARRARAGGLLPVVVYGRGQTPLSLTLDAAAFTRLFQREGFFAHPLNLSVNGKTHHVLPREVQLHPLNDRPIHADFLAVGAKTRVTVSVPVHFAHEDQSPGLKRGGVLNVVRHDVELVCHVAAIPEQLTADLSGLDIGDSVHISKIRLPEGVRPLIGDRDFTVATIAAPTVIAEAESAAQETPEAEEEASDEGGEGRKGQSG